MTSDKMYQVMYRDFPKLEELLTACFLNDPLYCALIPDEETRKRLMPELFECDLKEFFESCEIYADSEALNSLLVVADETKRQAFMQQFYTETQAEIRTDEYLIKEDPTFKTFFNFFIGKVYLDSRWTQQLKDENRLHVIYLAVRPDMQHHGLADEMMEEVISYADAHNMLVSLETHNEDNLTFYSRYGFELFETIEKHFNLKQFCLCRKAKSSTES